MGLKLNSKIFASATLALALVVAPFISMPNASASTTYSFTNASATGRYGPTQAQVTSAYSGTTLAGQVTVNNDNGIQRWTVPATAKYKVTIAGAQGGSASTFSVYGGYGRKFEFEVVLSKDVQIEVLVGQAGSISGAYDAAQGTYQAGSGGGASWISFAADNSLLAVAGGGGGAAGTDGGGSSRNGQNATAADQTAGGYGTGGTLGGEGGANGSGGSATTFGGPGGGGAISAGASGRSASGMGQSRFPGGGIGGVSLRNNVDNGAATGGGFGGGAGAVVSTSSSLAFGGAGGGYSGGGGSGSGARSGEIGGGGGNFLSPSATFLSSSIYLNNSGHGSVTFTLIAPVVTGFSSASTSPTNQLPSFSLSFSSSVTGLSSADFVNTGTAPGCTFTPSASSGTSFTVATSSCSGAGTIKPKILANSIDSAGSAGPPSDFTSTSTITFDNVAPALSFSQPETPTKLNPVVVSLTSSETLVGLEAADFSAPGCSISVTGATSPYSVSLSNCTDQTSITLSMTGTVTDQAGNAAAPPTAVTFTADRVYQTGTLSSPSTPSNLATLPYSYTPGETLAGGHSLLASEITVSGTSCSLDSGSIAWSGTAYTFHVVGCADGATAAVSINAGALSDGAGNTNPQLSFSNVVLDKNVGVGIISEPANTAYNSGDIQFTLNFTEAVSGLNSNELAITGGSQGCTLTPFDEQNNIASYVVYVTGCQHGASVRLTLGVDAVFDAVGNYGPKTAVQTSAFVVDLVKPVLASVTPRASRQNSSTVVYDAVFSEAVTGVSASIFSTSSAGCSAPGLTGSGATYVVTLTGCSDGTVQLAVAADAAIEDAADNPLDPAAASSTRSIASVIVDTVAPTSSWESAPSGPLNSQTSYTINFSEAVNASSFSGSDITNAGSANGCVFTIESIDSDTFTITSSGCSDGTLQPVIAAGSILDLAGNPLSGAMTSAERTAGAVTLDFTAPSATISSAPGNPTSSTTLNYQVTFNEPVDEPTTSAFTMLGGVTGCSIAIAASQANPTTVFDLTISSCSQGLAILTVNADSVPDLAGNLGPASAVSASTLTIDRTPAVATVTAQTASPTKETTLVFGISFNEAITSLAADSSHFELTGTGCSIGVLSGSGTTYSLTVLGCDVATDASLAVKAGSVVDAAGNASPATTSTAATITTDRVPATVSSFDVVEGNDNGAVVYEIQFSEPTSGLADTDIVVSGVSVSRPVTIETISSSQYRVSLQALSSGTLNISLDSNSVLDGVGNLSPAAASPGESELISFDSLVGAFSSQPTLNSYGKINSSSLSWQVQVSRAIDTSNSSKTLSVGDLSFDQGSCTGVTVTASSATLFTINATGCSDRATELVIGEGAIEDPDGNLWPSADLSAALVVVDTTAVTVVATAPAESSQLVRHVFNFDFSEVVDGLTLADFALKTGSTATGCVLSYSTSGNRASVTVSDCSNGTIGVTLAANSVTDRAGNQGPVSAVSTASITQATVAPVVQNTPAVVTEPVLMATAPNSFVGPLSPEAQTQLVEAGIVKPIEGLAVNRVVGDFTSLAAPTAPAHLKNELTIDAGGVIEAELLVDPSFEETHQLTGYLKVDSQWLNLGSSELDSSGVVTVPAAFTRPGSYFIRIVVEEIPLAALSFRMQSLTDEWVMSQGVQSLELTVTVTGTALELTPALTTAPIYEGPLLTNAPLRVSSLGGEVSFEGQQLDSITKANVGKIELEIIELTKTRLTLRTPALAPGNYSLTITSSFGKLSVQDALIVTLEVAEYEGPGTFVTKRISESEIKIYAKGVVGLGKVQILVNGREIAWVRAIDETDPKLRIHTAADGSVGYLVRSVKLDQRLRIEIRIEGQRAKFATYNP